MNNKVTDKDGFSYVSYKGKKKHLKQPVCPTFISKCEPDSLQNFHAVMRNVQDELKYSDFIFSFKENLHVVLDTWDLSNFITQDSSPDSANEPSNATLLNQKRQNIDIVCYGLGQFSSCIIARYQLGFLLILKQFLHSINVYIYDPQFSVEEISFLKELGMDVLSINEEAKRKLKRKSFCFMPHCDLPLYNNLLWANWSVNSLSELVIIGNSFQSYELNDAKGRLKEKAKYVHLANKFITEIRMTNVFRFTDIFNDLSIHYFKPSSLSLVDLTIWTDFDEPEYSDDEEIIKSV